MTKSKLFAVVLAGACAFGVWRLGTALFAEDEAQSTQHLTNQIWIDHMPTDRRDMIQHLVVLDHPEGKFGAVGRSSTWRHLAEVFIWKLEGSRLAVYFPQESVRGAVGVRTWRCEGEAPKPFDLCLELRADSGETAMMYSKADWKIRPHDMADSLESILDEEPELIGVIEELDEGQLDQLEDFDLDDQSWRERPTLLVR